MFQRLLLAFLISSFAAGAQLTTEQFNRRNEDPLQSLKGKPLPDFVFPGSSGRVYTNKNLLGKVTLIDIWEVGCGPCMYSIKYLNAIKDSLERSGFQLLSFVRDDWKACLAFRNQADFEQNYMIPRYELISMGSAIKTKANQLAITRLNEYGWPLFLVVDRKGIVRAVSGGFSVGNDVHAERAVANPWANPSVQWMMTMLRQISR